jgi:hypothetical protein
MYVTKTDFVHPLLKSVNQIKTQVNNAAAATIPWSESYNIFKNNYISRATNQE